MSQIWHDVLYQPLLNALFFLYGTIARENLGLAIMELTVAIRLLLLPLSILSERKAAMLASLSQRIDSTVAHFKNDPVKQREEARRILKEHRVNPWAKAIVLAVQVLVLVLLYQVFVGGLRSEKLVDLYAFVRRPDFVNTIFFGFDIALRNRWWAFAVGVVLFLEIVIAQRERRHILERRDVFYRYAFPIVAIVALSMLPMVKSIFILTSMACSAILFGVRKGVTTK
ncbi:YidC/Oxa1 family membrane protein insertase [Candidatus Uhrbacteria bacterium]|nr:YidC/Oxa1 family membrane protein insertase [Candidatus Uhrbacteria bacterium]